MARARTGAAARGWTRRELIAAGAAAGGAAVAGGGPGPFGAVARAAGGPAPDRDLLVHVLGAERLVLWTYERVLEHGTIGIAVRMRVERIRDQERRHVAAIERMLGGSVPGAGGRLSLAAAERELARHHVGASPARLATQHDCIRLLVDVESLIEGAWFAAIGKLADPGRAAVAASIMACEAQHWTVLSALAHHGDPRFTVPYPFVRGSTGY